MLALSVIILCNGLDERKQQKVNRPLLKGSRTNQVHSPNLFAQTQQHHNLPWQQSKGAHNFCSKTSTFLVARLSVGHRMRHIAMVERDVDLLSIHLSMNVIKPAMDCFHSRARGDKLSDFFPGTELGLGGHDFRLGCCRDYTSHCGSTHASGGPALLRLLVHAPSPCP